MARKTHGIEDLRRDIENAWNEKKDDIKEEYKNDPSFDQYEVNDIAHEVSETLSFSNSTNRTEILIELQNGEYKISDLGLLDIEGKQPHEIINDLVNTFIYDQAQEIFYEKFEEARKDWDEELENEAQKGPGE